MTKKILLSLGFIISLVTIVLSSLPFKTVLGEKFTFTSIYTENEFMHTIDLFDENFQEIRHRETIVSDLCYINDKFSESPNFDFIEMCITTCYPDNNTYRGNQNFAFSENEFFHNKHQNQVKCLKIGKNVSDFFDLPLTSGTFFAESDYYYKDSIKIILGYNYKDLYALDETIPLVIDGMRFDAVICGFLEKDTKIVNFNETINLDDFIVTPFIKFNSSNQIDKESQFRLMLDKNNGIINPKASINEIKNEINTICNEVNLPPYALSITYDNLNKYITLIFLGLTLALLAGMAGMILSSVFFIKSFRKQQK